MSAIGFAIVFLAITVATSAAACILVLLARGRSLGPGPAKPDHPGPRVDRGRSLGPGPAKPDHPGPRVDRGRLRSFGAAAEKSAAAAAIAVPPLVAAGVTLLLAARSAFGAFFGLADHCAEHVHHLHLCVFHGASWGDRVWAVAIVAAAGAWLATALFRGVRALRIAGIGLRQIERLAKPERVGSVEVLLAPARIPFCFAAGMCRPRIFVSTEAWSRWTEDERRAAIEHERAHLASRDLLRRFALSILALFGAPFFTHRVLSLYDDAAERACDRRAAAAVGDPAIVASALLACARRDPPVAFCASFLSASSVERRIEALLVDAAPERERLAAVLRAAIAASTIALLIAAAIFADPLHHVLESLLG